MHGGSHRDSGVRTLSFTTRNGETPSAQPDWVCASGHPPRRSKGPEGKPDVQETGVGGKGLLPRTVSQNTNQLNSHPCFKIPCGLPCLPGNVQVPYGGKGPLPSDTQAFSACLLHLSRFPTSRSSCAPQSDREMGGGFWEGQGPTGAFGDSNGSCLRPALNLEGAWAPGLGLHTKRMFHVLVIPWVTCPFVFLGSLAVPSEISNWC